MNSLGLAFALFSEHTELVAGLILSGTVPSATAATSYTFLAGGDTSLVIAASLLDIAISPVVTPLKSKKVFLYFFIVASLSRM